MIKSFFLNDRNIEKNSYMWNMAGSMLNAFQSFLLVDIGRNGKLRIGVSAHEVGQTKERPLFA